jgi:lysophospholipase L1-like esterase
MPRYPYRDLGTGLGRDFRNNLNANFDDVEADIKEVKNDLDARFNNLVITASKIDVNLLNNIHSLNANKKIKTEALFDTPIVNLFNKDTVTMGYYLINGVPTASPGNCYSDYIPVKPGVTYWFTRLLTTDAGALYDANYNFVQKFAGDGTNLYTIPANIYYVRINISPSVSPLDSFMVVEGSTPPAVYKEHHVGKIKGLQVDADHIEGAIYPEQLADTEILNLFDPSTAERNKYLSNTGVVSDSSIIDLSRFIKVTPGETIGSNFKYAQQGGYYSPEKKWIKQITLTETSPGSGWFTETVPDGAAFIRVNVVHNDLSSYMLTKSATKPKGYSPYGVKIPWLVNGNKLAGKRIATFGDSITWLDGKTVPEYDNGNTVIVGYQHYMRQMGAIVDNFGHSGDTLGRRSDGTGCILDVIRSKTFENYDIVTIFGGTNDVGTNTPFGVVGTESDTAFDETTSFGALRSAIEYIRSSNPKCRIYLLTPIRSNRPTRPVEKMEEISEGIRQIGKMYSCPVIDMLTESGIGKGTYDTYLYDGLHPNNDGFKVMGEYICSQLLAK